MRRRQSSVTSVLSINAVDHADGEGASQCFGLGCTVGPGGLDEARRARGGERRHPRRRGRPRGYGATLLTEAIGRGFIGSHPRIGIPRSAKGRAAMIEMIDGIVRRLRRDLGESAKVLAEHDRPLPRATTPSLDALRRYADGLAASYMGRGTEAIELLEQAVVIDSDFALVHAELRSPIVLRQ